MGTRFPWTMNKYTCGNTIYPTVLTLVPTEYDLAENSYGHFISIFFFFFLNRKSLCNCRILSLLSQSESTDVTCKRSGNGRFC